MPPIAADPHPADESPRPKGPRFPVLEGLRAVSALAVVAYHAGTTSGYIAPAAGATAARGGGAWLQQLAVAVPVFFVISGFLIFRPFVVAHLAGERGPATGGYVLRRLVRIFPAYWAALTASVLILNLHLGDWWSTVRIYGLLQIYAGDTVFGGIAQAWTLCTELSFYLFLPIWAWALSRVGGPAERKIRAHYLGLALLYVGGLAFRAELRAGGHAIGYAWLPANIDLFALGMALAVASAAAELAIRPLGGLLRTVAEVPAAGWVAAGCCYFALVTLNFPVEFVTPTLFQEVGREAFGGFVAVLVVAVGVVGPDRGAIRRFLLWRPVMAVGTVSYGLYLWHLTLMGRIAAHRTRDGRIVAPIGRHPGWVVIFLLTAAGSIAVATVSWFTIERPLLRKARSHRPGASAEVGG